MQLQKSICEFCRKIGHKADACIIRGPKFLPTIIRRNINQFNALHGDEPKQSPREWNSQPPEAHLKSRSSPSRTSPVVSDIMGKLNHCAIDYCDITSDIPVESSYDFVQYPETTPIKSIVDDDMDHLLELFHSEHNDNLLDVDFKMLQA